MRGLYEVFIVDPEAGEIIGIHRIIAKSGASAKIKALSEQDFGPAYADVDVDDLDVIVVMLGDIRDKKEIQEVRIIQD